MRVNVTIIVSLLLFCCLLYLPLNSVKAREPYGHAQVGVFNLSSRFAVKVIIKWGTAETRALEVRPFKEETVFIDLRYQPPWHKYKVYGYLIAYPDDEIYINERSKLPKPGKISDLKFIEERTLRQGYNKIGISLMPYDWIVKKYPMDKFHMNVSKHSAPQKMHDKWSGTWKCSGRGELTIGKYENKITGSFSGKMEEDWGPRYRNGGTVDGLIVGDEMKLHWKNNDNTTCTSTSHHSIDGKKLISTWSWYNSKKELMATGTMECNR